VRESYDLLAPAGTPKPIIARLSAVMRRILALPEVAARLAAIGMLRSLAEELGTFIRHETDREAPSR
jgi:tripartite-type tricarboxylate transporter receptor subunit TctC